MRVREPSICAAAVVLLLVLGQVASAEFYVGAATADITPEEPVALAGQFGLRISTGVETPLSASVVAVESRRGEETQDAAVLVSCDVVSIPVEVTEMVREKVKGMVPDLDPEKIVLAATHTHTAPELRHDHYELPESGVMQIDEYRAYFVDKLAGAIAEAWKERAPGSFAYGLDHAVVAYNRRAVYADGSARMYGPTDVESFRSLEGYEDHDVGSVFFWDDSGELLAILVNVSCPAQEVESRRAVNADYWHPVRESLRRRYGSDVSIVGTIGAAGDQSPHLMYRDAADNRMTRLRGEDRLHEIARRIVRAVEDTYEVVKDHRKTEAVVSHRVEDLKLPCRLVTESEYDEAKAAVARSKEKIEANPKASDQEFRRMQWYGATVERFERQKEEPNPTYAMELHAIRLGDVALCTNAFELFTDFGIRMKARSKATQTFVIQLAGPGTYVPTEKAVAGGHYSAVVHSSHVGPKGGQTLVDATVEAVNSMWSDEN